MIDKKEAESMEPGQLWLRYNNTYLLMYGLVFFLTINEGAGLDALKQSLKDNESSEFLIASLERVFKSAKNKCPID